MASASRPAAGLRAQLTRALGRGVRWLLRVTARAVLRALAAPALQRTVACALFAALAVGASRWVRGEVNRDARYRIDGARIAALPAPPGMGPRAVRDLAALPTPGGAFQARDPDASRRIAKAYGKLGWVRSVDRVAIGFPNRLVVEISVRRPAAGLAVGERMVLLDEEGQALPADRYVPHDPRALDLPVLRGARGRDPRRDPAVRHGLAVAAALRSPPLAALFSEPVTIDISNVDGRQDPRRSEVVVRAGALTIEWGRAPITGRLHIPTAQKVARLGDVLETPPTGRTVVQLQYDDLVVRPETTAEASGAGPRE